MSPSETRSNDSWMAALRGEPDEAAVAELRRFLVKGLSRALADRGLGTSDVDDFAQDATLRVLSRLDSFRGESRFTTWALSIAIRIALTELRRKRWKDVSLDELELPENLTIDREASALERLEGHEIHVALHDAIYGALTERQRTVVLAELAGVPGVVLAERLDVAPGALYKMYHDARKKLRRALEEAGFSNQEVRNLVVEESNER